ncbi:MAG: biopolymer transporter ExbD [Alphaproteobacteria bacterium TMED89]|nr:MAG: biopolymer transporter ExbD [Alphaproteobacteria bacterium TMED89]
MALRSLTPGDRSNRTRYRPMTEINVTPFVDVMLILLVVFMVSAPLLTIGVPLDLPEGDAPALNEADEAVTLSIQPDGSLFLNDQPTSAQRVLIELEVLTGGNRQARIFLRGDRTLLYGDVMGVMADLAAEGYTSLRLVAEPPGSSGR